MDKARVTELKTALAERVAKIDEATTHGVKVDGANVEISAEVASSIRSLMGEANEIKALIEADKFTGETKAWMNEPADRAVSLEAQPAPLRQSLGQAFTNSEEFKSLVKSGRLTMDSPFEISAMDITGYGQKDVYAANGSASYTRTMGGIQFDPIVPRGQRPTRVRDLFPVAATSASLIDYFRVTGYAAGGEDGNAAPVGDYASGAFVAKPKSNLVFESVQAPVRTIAHYEAAHRNVLDDVPQLQALIDNELMYGLRLQEDYQILSGQGGDGLTGIMETTGVQTYTQASSEVNSDALRRAATKVILSNYQPTGYVLHPNDWENTELQRGEDGQYMLAVNVAIGADTRIWRLPVVETPAMTEGTFLAGAFGLGAQVYDRQVANVRIAEQHSDFFIRNAVAVLAEQRIALAVKRPEAFVVGTWYSE
jgi:hypothetical protein